MKNLSSLIFLFLLLFSLHQGYSQSSYEAQLDEVIALSRSRADSLEFQKAYKVFNKQMRDSMTNACFRYKMFRPLGRHYFNVRNYAKNVETQHDSILPACLECFGEIDAATALQYFNVAAAYGLSGDLDKQEEFYEKTLRVENQLEEPGPYSITHYTWIGLFFADSDHKRDDVQRGLFYLEKALNIITEDTHPFTEFDVYRRYAFLLDKSGEYEQAIKYYHDAINLGKEIYPDDDSYHIYETHYRLSDSYLSHKQYDKAEFHIKKAQKILLTYYPEDDHRLNRFNEVLATIYSAQGKKEEALSILESLKEKYYNNPEDYDLMRMVGFNEDIGEMHLELNDYEGALSYFQKGINLVTGETNEDYLKNPTIKGREFIDEKFLSRLLAGKAEALYKLGKEFNSPEYYTACIESVQKFDTLVRNSLNQNWEEKSHLNLIEESRDMYFNGIESALIKHDLSKQNGSFNEAYNIAAKLKSQLLNRGIIFSRKKGDLLSDSLEKIEYELEDAVVKAETNYQTISLKNDKVAIKQAFDEYLTTKESLKIFLEDNGIDQVLTQSDFISIPAVQKIQKDIDANTAIVEYLLHEGNLYAFLISKEQAIYDKTALNVDQLIEIYGQLTIGENYTISSLSDSILSILKKANMNGISDLIIIPDQELQQFPFEILIQQNDKMLIEDFKISYEYSSGFLNRTKEEISGNKMVGFASDYTSESFKSLEENLNYAYEGIRLAPLKFSVDEVKESSELLKGENFINGAATKDNFKSESGNSQVIHLALHGLLNEFYPDQSALVFDSDSGDHLLTAAEIYNMEIPSKLTVLSACNSGVGPVRVGDGIRSMARSFIHAGSQSVLTSLWETSDKSTNVIMKNFYNYLNSGETKSEALRQAKLDYINKVSPTFQHPKYWAHLVLVGDNGTLTVDTNLSDWMLYLLPVLLILLLFFFYNARNKNRRD